MDFVYESFDRLMITIWEPLGYVPNMTYDTYIPPQQQAETVQADEPVVVHTNEQPSA